MELLQDAKYEQEQRFDTDVWEDIADEYLKMVLNPKHGYGKVMNPCIDCRIFMLQRAKQYMEEVGAHFIFTGEVVGQRPM